MNFHAIKAIYVAEILHGARNLVSDIITPVLSTSLYFIVFGWGAGPRFAEVDGISYSAYIVPGLMTFLIVSESIASGSFGIYMQKFTGSIYELLSAPVSPFEIVVGYVGAAVCKAIMMAALCLVTARVFVDFSIAHPVWLFGFVILTSATFCLLGFILGLWADGWQKLTALPNLVVMPLTFLGGTFYSIDALPPVWHTVMLFNPIVYLISGCRWSFYGVSNVSFGISILVTTSFLALCVAVVWWIFRTGYRLKA